MYRLIIIEIFILLNLGCTFDARISLPQTGVSKTYQDFGYVIMPQESISVSGEGSVSIQPIVLNSHKFKITPNLPECFV